MSEEITESGPEPLNEIQGNGQIHENGQQGALAETVDLQREGEEDPQVPAAEPPKDPPGRSFRLRIWDIIISAGVSVFIITFLYQPVKVEGTSMLPRLEDQDRLFINKFIYHFEKIERGDVVVFYYPPDPQKSYIKRVIAIPGDNLRIDEGRVYINGHPLAEPYVPRQYRDTRSLADMTLPPNYYFVMGDHRSISSDSRDFGPVPGNLIYGKASFVYWPEGDMGVVH